MVPKREYRAVPRKLHYTRGEVTVGIPGATEAQTKARTNRPVYIQKALGKVGELISQAAESGDLSVKFDLTTILPDLDREDDPDKYSLALAHLTMELNLRGYHIRDYKYPVFPKDGSAIYEDRVGFYVYWGWGAENDD